MAALLNKQYIIVILVFGFICSCTQQKQYTFTEDVAPIIYNNCVSCHHKNGPAPFAMQSYKDVVKRAKMISYVTENNYMPPWPADTDYSSFIGEKVLSTYEKEVLKKWYEQGALYGDSSVKINMEYKPLVKDQFGEPDLVLEMKNKMFIPGDNKDRFMVGNFPFEIPSDTNISLIEFVPANKLLVHHVNAHLLTYDLGREEHLKYLPLVNSDDHTDSSAFYSLNIPYDDGSFPRIKPSVSNYLPGVETLIYPEGIGGMRTTKQGAILVKDFHYGPSPIDDWDSSYFNIYFDSVPAKRPTREFIMGTQGISPVEPPLVIAPNELKRFTSELKIMEDISVLTINPHMHLLGKEFKAYALSPIGDTIPLIKIDKWNFRWQYFYTFKKMLHIPKGSTIKLEALFDNTLNNMDNPFNPPRFVSGRDGSMKTTDEMLQLIVTYLPYLSGDEHISLESDT